VHLWVIVCIALLIHARIQTDMMDDEGLAGCVYLFLSACMPCASLVCVLYLFIRC